MNYWGYCDCEENGDVKWTRPFGWYSSFHNAAFRQGDATVLTDDLDGVVTHVHCDTPRGSRKPRCEFGLDTTLCLSYQFYAPFIISNHRTGAFKASCPSGTVLTGLALLGNRHDHGRRRDGTQISEDPAGAMPRCGVLSGYRLKQSINGTSHDGTTRVLVANTKFEACPSGTVATGFEYGINRHGNGDPGALQCREYEAVNSVTGGRIVKSKNWIISGEIRNLVTRAQPLRLQMEGYFTKDNDIRLPFTIDEHFDVKTEESLRSAAELLQDQ